MKDTELKQIQELLQNYTMVLKAVPMQAKKW
jgi:hypothetical protein